MRCTRGTINGVGWAELFASITSFAFGCINLDQPSDFSWLISCRCHRILRSSFSTWIIFSVLFNVFVKCLCWRLHLICEILGGWMIGNWTYEKHDGDQVLWFLIKQVFLIVLFAFFEFFWEIKITILVNFIVVIFIFFYLNTVFYFSFCVCLPLFVMF